MDKFNINFKVLTDNDEVVGCELQAEPQNESQIFCASFPHYFKSHQARIALQDKKIIFDHSRHSLYPGVCEFALSDNDYNKLDDILSDVPNILPVTTEATSGFKVIKR